MFSYHITTSIFPFFFWFQIALGAAYLVEQYWMAVSPTSIIELGSTRYFSPIKNMDTEQ